MDEYENKGVFMVKDDEEDERLKEMREQYAAMLSKTGEEYKDRIKE